jgi:hypothetical protein
MARFYVVGLNSMGVRTNTQMLELLGGEPEFHEPNIEPVPELLVAELRDGFKEVDGCIVPRSFPASSIWSETRPRTDNIDDEMGFECSLSKVRLNDFVDSSVSLSELARIGCAYGMYSRRALLGSPVSGQVRIIVDAQKPDAELQVGNVCSVRFHRIRPGQTWLVDDLESYKENALWVFEFSK